MLDQIPRHETTMHPLTAEDLLKVIAYHGYRELDLMRELPDHRSARDSIGSVVYTDLTVSRSCSPDEILQALMKLRDWTGEQAWQHALEVANDPRYRVGREPLARWLAIWPFSLTRSLDDSRPPRDGRDVTRLIPPIVPGNMPTDRVTVKQGTVELKELLHLSRNSEIWLCEVPNNPGRFVIKFGLTRESRACLKQETTILRRLAPLKLQGVLMPLWNFSILSGPVRALTYRYVEDGSLAALLDRHGGRLSLREVNEVIMPQVLQTFSNLHRLDPPIVHADVKPQNMLADRDGRGQLVVVVNDCGASAIQPPEPFEGGPEPGQMRRAATPSYASLEQLSGWQPSFSDDIYALCVLWCRLLGIDPIDDNLLPADYLPIHWRERQRPGLREQLQVAGLTPKQIQVIVDGLGPNFQRPRCEVMLQAL